MTDTESAPSPSPERVAGEGPSMEERQWAFFAHLSALSGLIIPFGSLLGPLIIWQIKKDVMPFVDDQGKEALNFQITVALAVVVSVVLLVALIGFVLLPAIVIGALILTVIGAIKANNGEAFRYPLTLRLIN